MLDIAQASVQGGLPTPRDVAYYDVEWATGLSLEDVGLDVVAEDVEEEVDVLAMTWAAFEQTFASAPGVRTTLPWRQEGILCLPRGERRADISQGLSYNAHDAVGKNPELLRAWCIDVSRAFDLPVMIHGWARDVLSKFSGTATYHQAQDEILALYLNDPPENRSEVVFDGAFLVNGMPLVKGDMVALTVLQRAVESAWGATVDDIGALGISKEGQSHWILGAVDERVGVLSPGGVFLGSPGTLVERWQSDWGCALPDGRSDPLFDQAARLMDWIERSPAGQAVGHAFHPINWTDQILARHLLITADLGIRGQHDWIWPLLGEEEFFDAIAHPSWRFTRVFDGSGVQLNDQAGELGASLLPQVADALVRDRRTPEQPTVGVRETAGGFLVEAQTVFSSESTRREMVLVYGTSDESTFRAGTARWSAQQMEALPDGVFRAELAGVPTSGEGLVVYVLAREAAQVRDLSFWRSASSLPSELVKAPRPAPCTF
ncbi:MAG: hypothetical protein AAFY60_00470 [Myxococcota bacterium]